VTSTYLPYTVVMKFSTILATACATAVLAETEQTKPRAALLTIEVAPGETRQITEDERWELSAVGESNQDFAIFD
jgi:leucyl aminopeptidase